MKHPFETAREPVNSATHFYGAVASAAALAALLFRAVRRAEAAPLLLGVAVFGICLILLYTASCRYHFSWGDPARIERLRRLDHSMIYLLIAGSYTPFCIRYFPPRQCAVYLGLLWLCAVVGIVLKNCWMGMPRGLGTALYLALGWAALTQWRRFAAMPRGCFWLVLLGGVLYSIGGVIYAVKKPCLSAKWGSHELFHLFVLAGSLTHVLAVYWYVL